jgi:hypothetical protein
VRNIFGGSHAEEHQMLLALPGKKVKVSSYYHTNIASSLREPKGKNSWEDSS